MSGPIALVGTRYPDLSIEQDVLGPDVEIITGTGGSADDIALVASEATVIIAGSGPKFTQDVIERLTKCRAIVRSGIGVDSVDLGAAGSAGMWVVNVPDYGTEAVAQHALSLALAATRKLVEADREVRSGRWGISRLAPISLPSSMTFGVIGYGRIGYRVAELAHAIGFDRMLVHDPYQQPERDGFESVDLDGLLSRSDVVSLHIPSDQDAPVIGGREISLMRPESALVNTARGVLIDDEALAVGLAEGAPRTAALDVFATEPPDLSVFAGVVDRLILSPHMAWYSEESQLDLRRQAAEEALRLLNGQSPINVVVAPEAQE